MRHYDGSVGEFVLFIGTVPIMWYFLLSIFIILFSNVLIASKERFERYVLVVHTLACARLECGIPWVPAPGRSNETMQLVFIASPLNMVLYEQEQKRVSSKSE